MFDVDAWVDYLLESILTWLAEMLCWLFNGMMDIALKVAEFIAEFIPPQTFTLSWVNQFMSIIGAFVPVPTLTALLVFWLTWSATRWVLGVVLRLFTLGAIGGRGE